ncbi:MAG: hypothetical protein ACLTDV_01705 [Eubacterium sp.]
MGGTQSSGYKQGVGESVTFGTDSGDCRRFGWYGGYVTNANNGSGGAGGSGYTASGLTNTEMGSGYAAETVL